MADGFVHTPKLVLLDFLIPGRRFDPCPAHRLKSLHTATLCPPGGVHRANARQQHAAHWRREQRGTSCGTLRSRRGDVLVEPEDVVGVAASLQGREPGVLRVTVGGPHTPLAFVAEEVDVDAATCLWLERGEEVARPPNVICTGLVAGKPGGVDVDVEGGVALRVGGRIFGNATRRAAELEEKGVGAR